MQKTNKWIVAQSNWTKFNEVEYYTQKNKIKNSRIKPKIKKKKKIKTISASERGALVSQ